MNEHDTIAENLTDQSRALQGAFDKIHLQPPGDRDSARRILEAETFYALIINCPEIHSFYNWIRLDPAGAESFLALAKYSVPL